MTKGFVQQRAKMTKAELREELDSILVEFVPGNEDGPSLTMLRKASIALDRIMRVIEAYES